MADVLDEVHLWDGVAPGSEGWTQVERSWTTPAPTATKTVRNVVDPTLTPVLPDPSVATGAGVLVCPGGGYAMLSMEHEGVQVAEWLAGHGVAAFVLKYRLMPTPESEEQLEQEMARQVAGAMEGSEDRSSAMRAAMAHVIRRMAEFAAIPLADGREAMKLVAERCTEWGIRTDRLGALGFSAGGRLALDLVLQRQPGVRPAFLGAVYPVFPRAPVPDDAPPLFVAVAHDDPLYGNALEVQAAWRDAGRPVEAHFYARGGHGFGLHEQSLPADHWIDQFHAWMVSEGFTR